MDVMLASASFPEGGTMRVSRAARAVLAAICWICAAICALGTAGAFAGGGVLCQAGRHEACHPQTWLLILGVVLTLAFGTAGALIYKPKPKGRQATRKPWEYGP
jgi:hypothetical protein